MNNDIRNLQKWLNEEQEAPIDRKALARVLAMVEQSAPEDSSVAQPIYQCQDSNGKWTDQAKHSYDYNRSHAPNAVLRVVYTSPQPAQPDETLLSFYQATDFPSLVFAMERHIKKMQSKLQSNPHTAIDAWNNREMVRAAPQPAQRTADTKRLDALAENSWDLRCFDIPTGEGDGDIGWRVIEHHMAKPCERTVAEVFRDDPRQAIDEAIEAAHGIKENT